MSLPVLFGANIDPVVSPVEAPVRQALLAERLGLDLLTVQDHPYQPAFHDTWTLVTALATVTGDITVVPTVAPLPLRPPAILAKAAASLDVLTGGRVQLGLGTGAFWDAIAALGGPRRTPKEAVDALEDALDVIRAMWSGQRSVRTEGAYYRLDGVHPGPRPSESLGVWLGAYGPRMLGITGAKADGWLPSYAYLGLDRLGAAARRIDDAARDAGRDPLRIRKVYNIAGAITDDVTGDFAGPVQMWVDRLVALVEEVGMNGFVLWPTQDFSRQISLFATEVVPGVRAALAR